MNLNFTTFAQIRLAWTAGYCYRRCDVAWYVCWAHPVSSAKTDKPIEMPFEQKNHVFDGGCTSAPPGGYDGIFCGAAEIQAVATITAATI